MPIYEYRCTCGLEIERFLPLSEYDQPQICKCGKKMQFKVSLPKQAVVPLTGRDKVLKTLNKEGGFDFPGGNKHRLRYEQSMAKGLDYVVPLEERVFTGFG